jgi:hypothetical protein
MQEPSSAENTRDVFEWRVGGKRFALPDVKYRCPGCDALSMRFVFAGCWD